MKKSFSLSVPKPCTQKWNTMSPNEQGRHCSVCTKTVIDFTQKSDREIAKLVKSGNSICGRFKKSQLDRSISLPRKRDVFFEIVPPSYAASLLIPIAILGTQGLAAQESITSPIEQVSVTISKNDTTGKIVIHPSGVTPFVITGTVSDESSPLPGANIIVKGTRRGVQTDFDGNFELEVYHGETIVISFLGYADQEVHVDRTKNKPIQVALNYDGALMGEIIITGMLRQAPSSKDISKT